MWLSYLFGCRRTIYNITTQDKESHSLSQRLDADLDTCIGRKLPVGINSVRLPGRPDRGHRHTEGRQRQYWRDERSAGAWEKIWLSSFCFRFLERFRCG